MMRSFILNFLCVISLTSFVLCIERTDDELETMKTYAEPCFGKDGTTEDDFMHMFKENNDPETPAQKCLITCMQERVSIIKENKFDPENFKSIMKAASRETSYVTIIDDIAKECESVTDDDRCELGYKLGLCYKEIAEKHGADFDKMQAGE
uniref:CSON000437 protein n=1 Tax=Culicoides sonorensis TaxID=179676 RepID=A0A336KXA2_CULSO